MASDHYRASLDLTAAMQAASPRPIAFLCANPALPSIAARLRGFLKSARSVDVTIKSTSDDVEAGRRMMADLLSKYPLASHGVLCSSLLILEGALKEIRARGWSVPSDLLVGTYDDHPMLDFLPCQVVSAAQDIGAIAQGALNTLQTQSDNKIMPTKPILFRGKLIERRSVTSIPA